MANAVKKKGKTRRLKKSIRKTLGALFLASALTVAAIPTEGLQAADGARANTGPSVSEDVFSKMPHVDENATIYTYPMEGTGVTFRFAYVSPENGEENSDTRVAVILGYTQIGNLEGGTLRIPDTVEAYKKYSLTSTDTGSVAVNMDRKFLYYMRREETKDVNGNTVYERATASDPYVDAEGYKLTAPLAQGGVRIPVTHEVYYPCYYATRTVWNKDTILYESVYDDSVSVSSGDPTSYKVSSTERISAAKVVYIGSQYLKETESGVWKIVGDVDQPEQGIFYNQTNITNLIVGKDVMGVGDYAFANCGLRSVQFGNGLGCLGNYAFANCGNLTDVKFELSSSVSVIGSHAFNNCVSLKSIDLPGNIQQLGDSAFEGCQNLENIKLVHSEYAGSLTGMGQSVFKDCSALTSLEFPYTYGTAVDVSEFEGCINLSYIKTNGNSSFALKEGDVQEFGFKEFKETVLKAFYLEGPKNGALHKVATAQRIAYKFRDPDLNMDVYELVVDETEDGSNGVIYWVNEEGRIVRCEMENPNAQMTTITLPEVVGPKTIIGIDSGTFQNKCFLKKITIPASVTYIAENAFKGSHSLKDVIFTAAQNVNTIGTGAFNTQEAATHLPGCGGVEKKDSYLNFVGTISSACRPFTYAMEPSEYVNTSAQYRTYITYYSGWPTNLAVRYNETADSNELIDYPTFAELSSGKYNPTNYAYITQEQATAALEAVSKYNSGGSMTDYERQIIDAALNLNLPDGIESIATVDALTGELVADPGTVSNGNAGSNVVGLFTYKEQKDVSATPLSKSLTAESIQTINPGAFRDCTNFVSVEFKGPLKSIGNYAFDGCNRLTKVSISESVSELGRRPFTGCKLLSDVDFNGSQKFKTIDSIIYEVDANGNKEKLVEYLCGRKVPTIDADELAGLKEIYPEAFMNTGVMTVDLSATKITNVPENAFRETPQIFSVVLPNTCQSISNAAFTDSSIKQITIPRSVVVINNEAFGDVKQGDFAGMTDKSSLIFYTPADSVAGIFADENGILRKDFYEPMYYKVTFFDWDGTLLETLDKVEEGTAAVCSVVPSREGYTFKGWVPPVDCVTEDTTTTAQYEIIDPDTLKVTVRFLDWDDTELKVVRVVAGESAEPPRDPVREGYVFIGWRNSFENVTEDVDVYAQYEKIDSSASQHIVRFIDWDETVLSIQKVDHGGSAIIPKDPVREGYVFDKWLPTPTNVTRDLDVYATYTNGSGNPNNPGNPGNPNDPNNPGNNTGSGNGSGDGDGNTSKLYTLTVRNGSGSGSYVAGSQPIVIANDPSATQEFSHWTIDPEDTKIASKVLTATVITMPERDVTVTAHYRARTSSSNGSGSSSSVNSGRRPTGSGSVSNGGTTVVIDKNGLSNTGVVSATVNGSSDNFVIKITESSEATEAVVRALMAEYGSLDNIKYFPMDISLYDATGTNKITDTSGLSVSITLPLPDSLITYAGNNRVAGVVNDKLDKLTPKFTTISGVSCVTFTAEHFSPYVIYVDTGNLSSGTVSDSTPKTGDGIHPKWFLSIGLACLSFVMFMQKDKKKPQKVKVTTKA